MKERLERRLVEEPFEMTRTRAVRGRTLKRDEERQRELSRRREEGRNHAASVGWWCFREAARHDTVAHRATRSCSCAPSCLLISTRPVGAARTMHELAPVSHVNRHRQRPMESGVALRHPILLGLHESVCSLSKHEAFVDKPDVPLACLVCTTQRTTIVRPTSGEAGSCKYPQHVCVQRHLPKKSRAARLKVPGCGRYVISG